MMSASTGFSISGTHTSAPVASRDRGHRADVVEVRVGEQDPLERHAQLLDRAEQLRRLLAGVDDQRPVGAVAAEQEAVLRDRPDGEHADVHGAGGYRARRLRRCRKRRWRESVT